MGEGVASLARLWERILGTSGITLNWSRPHSRSWPPLEDEVGNVMMSSCDMPVVVDDGEGVVEGVEGRRRWPRW